jgi:hypothetical protein
MRAEDFYRHYKSIASAEFQPAILGSDGKHANHEGRHKGGKREGRRKLETMKERNI